MRALKVRGLTECIVSFQNAILHDLCTEKEALSIAEKICEVINNPKTEVSSQQ